MEDVQPIGLRIRQAAFALAERGPWHEIGMAAIAREAGLSLSEAMRHAPSKVAILTEFSRDIDEAMLLFFERYPAEGEAHDRLFEVILKRLEILQPYRRVMASVIGSRRADPTESARLIPSLADSIGWMISAARVEAEWQPLGRIGLTAAYLRVLAVWGREEDPGMTRTMAALDRSLRDIERLGTRASGIAKVLSGLGRAAGAFVARIFEEGRKS